MRILLTGVTGQVGGALLKPLAAIGTVLPAERSVLDLAEPESIGTALDRLQPELIVNPAAYTAVDLAEDERSEFPDIGGTTDRDISGVRHLRTPRS